MIFGSSSKSGKLIATKTTCVIGVYRRPRIPGIRHELYSNTAKVTQLVSIGGMLIALAAAAVRRATNTSKITEIKYVAIDSISALNSLMLEMGSSPFEKASLHFSLFQ